MAVHSSYCDYDGFHESLVEYYDSLGVQIMLNPSHSDRNWEQPAGFNSDITVGEAWQRHGVAPMIQSRVNVGKHGQTQEPWPFITQRRGRMALPRTARIRHDRIA